MRVWIGIILMSTLVGCATHPKQPVVVHPTYLPAEATALVFAPAIARNNPPLDLSRDGRDVQAFYGYEDLTVTTYDIRLNDDQYWSHPDGYFQRQTLSDRVGVSYR